MGRTADFVPFQRPSSAVDSPLRPRTEKQMEVIKKRHSQTSGRALSRRKSGLPCSTPVRSSVFPPLSKRATDREDRRIPSILRNGRRCGDAPVQSPPFGCTVATFRRKKTPFPSAPLRPLKSTPTPSRRSPRQIMPILTQLFSQWPAKGSFQDGDQSAVSNAPKGSAQMGDLPSPPQCTPLFCGEGSALPRSTDPLF